MEASFAAKVVRRQPGARQIKNGDDDDGHHKYRERREYPISMLRARVNQCDGQRGRNHRHFGGSEYRGRFALFCLGWRGRSRSDGIA